MNTLVASIKPRDRFLAARQKGKVESSLLGVLIFVTTEVMLFLALISAFVVIKSGHQLSWSPPQDIQLPIAATGFNTVLLILSGVLFFITGRSMTQKNLSRSQFFYGWTILLGGCFVLFQGFAWIQLVQRGMTLTSNVFSACFYLLVGCHALHAILALAVMVKQYVLLKQNALSMAALNAMLVFWLFVVIMWPILYALVYL